MVVLSHPTGNANVRAAAYGLAKAGLLAEFWTSIASFPGDTLDKLGVVKPLRELQRRRFEPILKPVTRTWPWYEMGRLLTAKVGFTNLTKHETGPFCVDAVYQQFDRRVASTLMLAKGKGISAVYAYEDGAAFSFREARHLGLACLYDLPIGYWKAARRLLESERERRPEWASTLKGFDDSPAKLARKDDELRHADRIFVASSFTAKTLQDYPGPLCPIEVIPYGFPPVATSIDYPTGSGRRPLKLLFVGGLSQRKGIADLFAVVDALTPHVQLTVVGRKVSNSCPALDIELAKHRWIPSLSHVEILKLMQAHDVLVFPSLFEGFGLVITEAMSQGTPVITTDRTAGPDFIQHGQNGWLVEAGSTQSLQAAIEELLIRPEMIAATGRAAMETARHRPWEVYERELAESVRRHLQAPALLAN